ncbi:MazG family protein [Rhodococcus sp. IEGM 1379]|uniref:MazG family protein n=1 Tax=Rhodococcus sp. IEGM 1379 TaxID=3047086 RepID=UPI0024B79DF8|nr:MazG family protein [Rhodococcus sp. IEGM 1379]MDI9917084.1 MazG family protein [Rhodococcus sp. IEGM 1379]
MTEVSIVVLLDPLRPDVVPIEAVWFLTGPVHIDGTVPEPVRAALPDSAAGAAVIVMMDGDGPRIAAFAASGARIVRAAPVRGDRLVEAASIMDRLWKRGGWEATQTHESLSVYLVEETYEVLDAILSGDETNLREELGDLLLQVLFHSRIAQAHGVFELDDVAGALIDKLVHRSPHLTSSGVVDIAEQELAWERLKDAEKARASSMDGIAKSQPPILLAKKVMNRAARAGVTEIIPEATLEGLIERCREADAALVDALDLLIAEVRHWETQQSRT